MDLTLTPEMAAFRDEVRAFLNRELTPELRRGSKLTPTVFVEPDIGQEWQARLEKQGWLLYDWPASAGGTGWTPIQRFIFEKECADAGAPALPGMGLKLVGPVIYTFGTPAQKERYLPALRSGEHFWAQGFSEPGSGSDLASLRTRAELGEKGWVVNGVKLWTTQAHFATHLFCLARTSNEGKPQAGISFFLIDMNQPGVRVRPVLGASGDHEVNEVFLDDVHAEELIGHEGQGWAIAKFLLQNERGGGTYGPKLVAAARDLAQKVSTLPCANDPIFKDKVDQVIVRAEALEATELRILSAMEHGHPPDALSLTTKLVASEIRQDIDYLNFEAHGMAGLQLPTQRPFYGSDMPAAQGSPEAQMASARYLNSRAWSIFGGTSEVQLNIIARSVLDM